jgi:hypothetical protein
LAAVAPYPFNDGSTSNGLSGFQLRAIVVEAAFDDVLAGVYRSRVRPTCVVGTLVALHADYGIPTIWAGSARNAAQVVERLLVRVWKKNVAEAA